MENGVPTYAYDLEKAVEDGYLVSYHSIETKLELPTDGLHYDDLSQEDKEYFDSQFEDDSLEKDIDAGAFNSFIFNKSTVEIVLDELMTRGIQTASGDDIGKLSSLQRIIIMLNLLERFLINDILKRGATMLR